MNWEAIGAAAEMIGALAVLVTLIFLVFQLRQNTLAIERETTRANLETGTGWMYNIVRDPEVASLYVRGLQNELQDARDKVRFNMLMQALFNQWAMAYSSDSPGGVSEADVAYVLATPGGLEYWKLARGRGLVGTHKEFASFVSAVESRLNQ